MNSLIASFRDCGWAAWVCLFIAVLGILGGLLGVLFGALKHRTGANVLGIVAVALGLLALATGVVGRIRGETVTEQVLASGAIDPEQKERIRAEGLKEASQCVTIGLGTAALPFLMGVVAVALGMSLQKKA